jgi:hypothetical protein
MQFDALGIVQGATDFILGGECAKRDAKNVEFAEFAAIL